MLGSTTTTEEEVEGQVEGYYDEGLCFDALAELGVLVSSGMEDAARVAVSEVQSPPA